MKAVFIIEQFTAAKDNVTEDLTTHLSKSLNDAENEYKAAH